MSETKINIKSIPLPPTEITLDVVICDDPWAVERYLRETYFIDYDSSAISRGCDGFVDVLRLRRSEILRIVLAAPGFAPGVIVHEIIHVTWRLNQIAGNLFNADAQEFQAYLAQYIFDQIQTMNK